jgi:hypothetical protein
MQRDHWKSRADQAGDGFRTLNSVLVGALLGFSINISPEVATKLGACTVVTSQLAGLVALLLLGFSWVIQKSKSLARARTDGNFPNSIFLRNEAFDVAAFALFLFAASRLIFGAHVSALVLSFIVPLVFIAGVVAINALVALVEAETSK